MVANSEEDKQALQNAATLAEQFEGFSSTPYQDPAGVWTVGFGTTRDINDNPVTANTPAIDLEGAHQLMLRDLQTALEVVNENVQVKLTINEKAALIDFVYNLGAGNFASSTLLRLLNAGDYQGAADQFERWDHAGGVVLAGLLHRRLAEKALFEQKQ